MASMNGRASFRSNLPIITRDTPQLMAISDSVQLLTSHTDGFTLPVSISDKIQIFTNTVLKLIREHGSYSDARQ